jgi:hypothetical protein
MLFLKIPNKTMSAVKLSTGILWLLISCSALAVGESGQIISWGAKVVPYVKPGTKFAKISAGRDHVIALTTHATICVRGANNNGDAIPPI